MKKLHASIVEQLSNMWTAGVSINDIAHAMRTSPRTVTARAKSVGLPPRQKRVNQSRHLSPADAGTVTKKCLSCNRPFASTDVRRNRICYSCRVVRWPVMDGGIG